MSETKYENRLKEVVYEEFEKYLDKMEEYERKQKYYTHLFENLGKIHVMVLEMEDPVLKDIFLGLIHGIRSNNNKVNNEKYNLEDEIKELKAKLEKLT
jgi:uncharacterized protein (DUF342 family)